VERTSVFIDVRFLWWLVGFVLFIPLQLVFNPFHVWFIPFQAVFIPLHEWFIPLQTVFIPFHMLFIPFTHLSPINNRHCFNWWQLARHLPRFLFATLSQARLDMIFGFIPFDCVFIPFHMLFIPLHPFIPN